MEGIVEVTSSRRRKVEHLQNSEKKITALSSKILTLSSTTRMQSLTISKMSSTTWLLSSTIIIHIFNSSKICTGYILTPRQQSFPDFRVCHECEQSFVVKWPISEAAKSLVWANLSANGVSKSALFLVPTSFRQIV